MTASAAAFVGLAAACQTNGTPNPTGAASSSAAKVGGQLVVAWQGNPQTLLPHIFAQAAGLVFTPLIDHAILRLKAPTMDLVNDLAVSSTIAPDGLKYTFMLQKGVVWQDGEPVTARDVKFYFETIAHKDWPQPFLPAVRAIQGAPEYKRGETKEIGGIKVLADDQIEFTLTTPYSLFMATALAGGRAWLLPQHTMKDVPVAAIPKDAGLASKPLSCGPFVISDFKQNESVTLKANDKHVGGRPRLDTLVLRFIPDSTAALTALKSGGVDFAVVTSDQFDGFLNDPEYTAVEFVGTTNWEMHFDVARPLFSDARVRRAISHAIDRDAIIKALYRGRADPSYNLVHPSAAIFNPTPKLGFDVARAKQLLDQAGWVPGPDGIRAQGGTPLKFQLAVSDTDSQQIGLALQPYLKAIGIQADIDRQEGNTFQANFAPNKYDAAISTWGNGLIDPRQDIVANFSSARFDTDGYKNDALQALIDQATATNDDATQKKLYSQIQDTVVNEAIAAYLWRIHTFLVYRSKFSLPKAATFFELYQRTMEWQLK